MDVDVNPSTVDEADGNEPEIVTSMLRPRRMTYVNVKRPKRTTRSTSFKVFLSITIILFLCIIGALVAAIFIKKNPRSSSLETQPLGRTSELFPDKTTNHSCSTICSEVKKGVIKDTPVGMSSSGAFTVMDFGYIKGVYCDCRNNDDWIVFQRRMDGTVNFYRNWTDYKNGFGEVTGEFWLGLEAISNLTSDGPYKLRIDLGTADEEAYAEYSTFHVGNESTRYTLTIGGYHGNAGDSFLYHNGSHFSTAYPELEIPNHQCSRYYKGAWWFYDCYRSHLNGPWFRNRTVRPDFGIIWKSWKGWNNTLERAEMKIARTD